MLARIGPVGFVGHTYTFVMVAVTYAASSARSGLEVPHWPKHGLSMIHSASLPATCVLPSGVQIVVDIPVVLFQIRSQGSEPAVAITLTKMSSPGSIARLTSCSVG